MNTLVTAFIAQMQGDDLEGAYAQRFGGVITGGIGDCGKDVLTGDKRVPYVQVKSSVKGLQTFLADSLRFHRFIPVCIGEPGAKEEMIESLLKHGIWVGNDIPDRKRVTDAVRQVKYLCIA
jgi:hypothetical protein